MDKKAYHQAPQTGSLHLQKKKSSKIHFLKLNKTFSTKQTFALSCESNFIREIQIQERGLRCQKGRPVFGLRTKGLSSKRKNKVMQTEDFAEQGGHHHHSHYSPSKKENGNQYTLWNDNPLRSVKTTKNYKLQI